MRILKTLAIIILTLLAIGSAHADGCYVPKIAPGSDPTNITEPLQRAAILYMDGTEWLTLSVSYKGNASEFAWLVPTPATPEISEPMTNPFPHLYSATAPKIKFWLNADRWIYESFMFAGGYSSKVDGSGVRVLEKLKVGAFDAAVLKATDADDLVNWLSSNGYATSDKISGVLGEYIKRGWVFTALKIDTKSKANTINEKLLDPIVFKFPTSKMIYPLKVSSLNKGITKVELYVVTKCRVDGFPLRTTYATSRRGPNASHYTRNAYGALIRGIYGNFSVDSKEFQVLYDRYHEVMYDDNLFLTKLEGELSPEQMKEDIILAKSHSDTEISDQRVSPPLFQNVGAVIILPYSFVSVLGGGLTLSFVEGFMFAPYYFLAVLCLVGLAVGLIPSLRKQTRQIVTPPVVLIIVGVILFINSIIYPHVISPSIERYGYGVTGTFVLVFYIILAAGIIKYRKARRRKQKSADRS